MSMSHPLRSWRRKEGPFAGRLGEPVTQRDIAAAIGVVPSQISQIETGERQPSMKVAVRISEITGVSIDVIAKFAKPDTEISA